MGWAVPSYDYLVKVIDERGRPLAGVNVYTDDYRFADQTDSHGEVVLKNLRYNDIVHFSYLGYEPLSLPFHEIRKRGGIVRLVPQAEALAEIVVVGRRDDAPQELAYQVEKVDVRDMERTQPQTTADALASHANVFVQKTQMGGGSIVLRGFEANRVLLVVDGVRMNNAIYRSGHLQNAITVDNSMLERIEVIFGPGSLLYGSDALGGVVHFRSREPKLYFGPEPDGYAAQTRLMTRYASANREKTLSWNLDYGKQRWASFTSFRFSDYGDLRAGSVRPPRFPTFGQRKFFVRRVDEGDQVLENGYWKVVRGDSVFVTDYDDQVGTAYRQIDLTQKIKFQPNPRFYLLANLQLSSTGDVPRYDRLTELEKKGTERDLKFAEWYYGPQKRILAALKAQLRRGGSAYDRATLIAAYQKIDEDRLRRKFNREYRTFQLEDVYVYSFTADFDKRAGPGSFAWGVDFQHNIVQSQAGKVSLRTERVVRNVLTRYPGGGSRLTALGGYFTYRFLTPDSLLNLQFGLRYSMAYLFARFKADDLIAWPEEYVRGLGTYSDALTWSAGLILQPRNGWRLQLLAATAFRAPNIDDFGKIREKNGYVTIPNPALLPEETLTTEVTLSKRFGRRPAHFLLLSLTGYYTTLKNAMVRAPFALPDGSTTLSLDADELVTIAHVNAEEGWIYGLSTQIEARMADTWFLRAHASYTKGRRRFVKTFETGPLTRLDTLVPLAHIPPLFAQAALGKETDRWRVTFLLRHHAAKPVEEYAVSDIEFDAQGQMIVDRRGTPDNIEATPAIIGPDGQREYTGTYAWTTLNVHTAVKMGAHLWLHAGVDNILDYHYRPFASAVSAPGRNFILGLRGKF